MKWINTVVSRYMLNCAKVIVERIQDGEYKQETDPSEMQLCKELDLSRPTVRQAISELVSDGILKFIREEELMLQQNQSV